MPRIVVGTVEGIRDAAGGQVELEGHEVRALSTAGDGWWVLTGGVVWHGHPGDGWDRVCELEPPQPRCLLATAHGVLVGTAGAHLLRVLDGAVDRVAAFDAAPGRDRWYTPWGGPPDVRSMTVAPDGTLYVNVHVGGILRSDDDGASWEPTVDIDVDVHQVAIERGSQRVVAATGVRGLMVSPDGGSTWEAQHTGLHATYARAVTCTRDSLLLSASSGPGGSRSAVYRRALGSDDPFERCTGGLPEWFDGNIDTGCLDGGDTLVALTTPDGRVFASEDGGLRWEQVAAGLPEVRCLAVVP